MKFDDVIVKESLSDWMFGDRAKGGGGAGGGGKQKRQQAPKLDGKAGLTPQDKLSYKFFTTDFMSDALSSINSGIRSGLINPPAGAPGTDDGKDPKKKKGWWQRLTANLPKIAPSNRGDLRYGRYVTHTGNPGALANLTGSEEKNWQPYTLRVLKTGGYKDNPHGMTDDEIREAFPTWNGKEEVGVSDEQLSEAFIHHKMNYIVESIIEANGNEVDQAGGMELRIFMRDWLGQWIGDVAFRDSKPVLFNIMDELQKVYDSSKNPAKPVIDRNILMQLADGAWAVSAIGAGLPPGAENADGSEAIKKTLEKDAEYDPQKEFKKEYKDPQAPPGTKSYNGDYYVDEEGVWRNTSNNEKTPGNVANRLNSKYAKKQEDAATYGMTNYPKGEQLEQDGTTYTWHGARWTSQQTGRIATRDAAKRLNAYAISQLRDGTVEPEKQAVAESLSYSAIRAEKIALLQSR